MTRRKRVFVWIVVAAFFLAIVGIVLGPLVTDCWMSWRDFFNHVAARIGLFVVLSGFWLESARRWWKSVAQCPESGTRRFRQAGFIIVAWCGILAFPVLFWFIGHSFSAAGATSPQATELRQYEMEARGGNIQAMCQIGDFYERGGGVHQNYQVAMQWYKRAAAMDSAKAMANIGHLYEAGLGVPRNYHLALAWYHLGTNAGSGRAMFHLGTLYYMEAEGRSKILRRP